MVFGVHPEDQCFLLQSSGTILKELSLPLVEKSWLNLKLIAEVSDADSVDQVATKDSNFFISRVVFACLSHGTVSSRFVV